MELRDELIENSVTNKHPGRKLAEQYKSYDGLGFDMEPPSKPSSTNVQDTLFKQTNFANRLSQQLSRDAIFG